MQRTTLWLVLFLIPHWGNAQNQTDYACPKRCVCQNLSKTDPEYKVECKILPDSQLPLQTTEFKSAGFPSNLKVGIFERLKAFSVKSLDLSHGNIALIENDALYILNKATFIDLSHNRIKEIGSRTLRGCNSLKELRLSYNHITSLEQSCFVNFFNLETIYLDNNELSEFPITTNCLNLDISNNEIENIRTAVKPLESLNICGNPISKYDHISLKVTSAVSICTPKTEISAIYPNLTENLRIEYFPRSSSDYILVGLNGMYNLKELQIIGFETNKFIWPDGVGQTITHLALNHISLIENAGNEFLNSLLRTSVKSLDLSNSSQLAGILLNNNTIWDYLSDLEFIDLRSCNLITLGHLRANRRQISINAGKNLLHCDCKLAQQLKVGRIRLVGNDTQCATPEEYAGQACLSVLRKMCPAVEFFPENESTLPSEQLQETTSEIAKKRVEAGVAEKISPDEPKTNQASYIIIGVIIALALNNILIFSVIFFYFGLRRPNRIENGTTLYNIETSGRDSPSVNPLL